jgi:hypothetical protein
MRIFLVKKQLFFTLPPWHLRSLGCVGVEEPEVGDVKQVPVHDASQEYKRFVQALREEEERNRACLRLQEALQVVLFKSR